MGINDILMIIEIGMLGILLVLSVGALIWISRAVKSSAQDEDKAMLIAIVDDFKKEDKLNSLRFSNDAGAIVLEKELQTKGHVSAIGFCIDDDDDEDDYDEEEDDAE